MLLVSGVGVLAHLGWQFWGTNWMSHRAHERIVAQTERAWDADGPAGVEVKEGSVRALIRIPTFGDDYVVPVLEGVGDDVLAAGFGHFTQSAGPGQVGNYALAAHRITHGEPLRGMPDLQAGDTIIVETRKTVFTYELTTGGDDLTVDFSQGWVVDPLPHNPDAGGVEPAQRRGQRLITLTTCAELFHTDERLIAFGRLVDRRPREAS